MRTLSCFLVLSCVATAAEPKEVTVKKVSSAVLFYVDGDEAAVYIVSQDVAKPYFYPLNAPGKVCVTRHWPMLPGRPNETRDHVHQKSAWFCHGDVIPEGIELKVKSSDKRVKGVDFWAESSGHGKIVCVEVGQPKVDGSAATVVTKNEWRTPDGVKIMDEERTITFRHLGDANLIELDSTLTASVCPITFGDTKEGSMGIRVNDEIKVTKGNGTIVNADGKKNEKEVWGRESAWNDYSGEIGGKKAGIAIFDHPKNPHKSVWHTRDYGLMAANPFGRKESGFPDRKTGDLVKLAKGDKLRLRYALLLHTGDAATAKVAERYAEYAKH